MGSMTERVREGYAQYGRRDYSFVDEMFAEDIEWSVPGPQGVVRGRAAVQGFFDSLAEQFASHTITLDDAVETDGRLICFCHHEFMRAGQDPVRADSVMDWRHRDGRLTSMREVVDTLAVAVAMGMIPAEALQHEPA